MMLETDIKTPSDQPDKDPLFTRGYRRQNRRHWKWMMKRRREEVQDAIFGWIESYYVSDPGTATKPDWRAILGGPQAANNWEGITGRAICRWVERTNPDDPPKPKFVVDTLYKFERYCSKHFRTDPDGKRRRPPYIPSYPSFERFGKARDLNSRKARRPSGTRAQKENPAPKTP